MKIKNELLIVLFFSLMIILLFLSKNRYKIQASTLSNLKPGKATSADVIDLLGEPDSKIENLQLIFGGTVYLYLPKTIRIQLFGIENSVRSNIIIINQKCDCVKVISQRSGNEIANLFERDIIESYGMPEISSFYYSTTDANYLFYSSKGIAFAERYGKVVEIIYFEPIINQSSGEARSFLNQIFGVQ